MANLAFRNLTRAGMVKLATGQQMADRLAAAGVPVTKLTAAQILESVGGAADLSGLTNAQRTAFTAATPLWFYVLREAELAGGRLTGVGARIVVETIHRAMEGSRSRSCATPPSSPASARRPTASRWPTSCSSPSTATRPSSPRSATEERVAA